MSSQIPHNFPRISPTKATCTGAHGQFQFLCQFLCLSSCVLLFAFLLMLPTVLLSGFVFLRAEMPQPIYLVSFGIPATYFVEILRGIILRGADFSDLLPQAIGLAICCIVILTLSLVRFRKQLNYLNSAMLTKTLRFDSISRHASASGS